MSTVRISALETVHSSDMPSTVEKAEMVYETQIIESGKKSSV